MAETVIISAEEMQSRFYTILQQLQMPDDKALLCAEIFTGNSLDGVYTHGVNRFARFVQNIKEGYVQLNADPQLTHQFGGLEQWDGRLGAGPVNAVWATERAAQLAQEHGLGCVAMAHTNHWMRGGTYGWLAAKKGFAFIAWTNTIANMPAWKAVDHRLGNNPLVIALPYEGEAIVLDMAMSQYSFGSLEQAALKNELLPEAGGFDAAGNLTKDPAAIIESGRPLSIGYWKGAGLSLLLDILATILSGGLSTYQISCRDSEYDISQVFIAIDISKLSNNALMGAALQQIITDYQQSQPAEGAGPITYPGERVLQRRRKNTADGIPVLQSVWSEIMAL